MRVSKAVKTATRERILRVAEGLFQDVGFTATTTRDIAERSKIAAGTLFNYFRTKGELATALLCEALSKVEPGAGERLASIDTLDEALFAHVAVAFRALAPTRRYIADVLETTMSPFAVAEPGSATDTIRARHLETVHELIVTHSPPSMPVPSFVTMHLYWTLYLGVLSFWSRDESPNQEDTLALLDQSMRLFVASLAPSPAVLQTENTNHVS